MKKTEHKPVEELEGEIKMLKIGIAQSQYELNQARDRMEALQQELASRPQTFFNDTFEIQVTNNNFVLYNRYLEKTVGNGFYFSLPRRDAERLCQLYTQALEKTEWKN